MTNHDNATKNDNDTNPPRTIGPAELDRVTGGAGTPYEGGNWDAFIAAQRNARNG